MTFSDYREPSGPLYPQLGIIQLHQRIEILNVLFVNASLKKMVPSSLQNMFVFSRCHNHGLRNQLRLSMVNVRTTRSISIPSNLSVSKHGTNFPMEVLFQLMIGP